MCNALGEHAELYREWPLPMLTAAYTAMSLAAVGESSNALVVLHSVGKSTPDPNSIPWWFRELGKMFGHCRDAPGLVSGVPWLAKRVDGVALWMLWLQEKA